VYIPGSWVVGLYKFKRLIKSCSWEKLLKIWQKLSVIGINSANVTEGRVILSAGELKEWKSLRISLFCQGLGISHTFSYNHGWMSIMESNMHPVLLDPKRGGADPQPKCNPQLDSQGISWKMKHALNGAWSQHFMPYRERETEIWASPSRTCLNSRQLCAALEGGSPVFCTWCLLWGT
jgi:hypothetical protein